MIYAKSGESTVIIADNNEESVKELGKSFRFGAGAFAAANIFSNGAAAYQSVKNTKTAADVSKAGLVENTKVVGLKEATAQKGLELEMKAMEMGLAE